MVELSRPTPPEEPPRARGGWLSTVATVGLIVLVIAGLYVLSLGTLGPALLIGGGVFLLVALHYFVWGWWLSDLIRQDVEAEEQDHRGD